MAFLSKLFGKKDKNEEKVEKTAPVVEENEDTDELTEEEIEAAERFEQENAEEINSSDALEIDGEFSDFTVFKQEQEAEDIEAEEEAEEEDEEEIEEGEKLSFWEKLKAGLSKTKNALFGSVNDLLKNFTKVFAYPNRKLGTSFITGISAADQRIKFLALLIVIYGINELLTDIFEFKRHV